MFLDRAFTTSELNQLLDLYHSGFIDRAPDYLVMPKLCRSVVIITDTTSRGDASSVMYTKIPVIPRISVDSVRRLLAAFSVNPQGMSLYRVQSLLSLGFGCPVRKEYASLLGGYLIADDPKGDVVKSILALFDIQIKALDDSTDGDRWLYPAKMVKQLNSVSSYFVSPSVKEIGKNRVRTPSGQPVALMYTKTQLADGYSYLLSAAYEISECGHLVPCSTAIMHPDAVSPSIVRSFESVSLHSYTHVMVWGYLVWPKQASRNYMQVRFLDSEPYEMLIDAFAEYRTEEHTLLRNKLTKISYRESYEKKHGKAALVSHLKELRLQMITCERNICRKIKKTGPLASMSFVAMDLALLDDNGIRSVRSDLSKVHRSLGRLGFTTVTSCSNKLDHEIHASTSNKHRVWSVK